jgi:DNA-binding MarR family transcriptional regulator
MRVSDPTDRRVHLLYLTEEGRDLRRALAPIVREVLERSLTGISQDDLAVVLQTLKRVDGNLA